MFDPVQKQNTAEDTEEEKVKGRREDRCPFQEILNKFDLCCITQPKTITK